MRDKQFGGYKEVVDLTADFIDYKAKHADNPRPVEGYIRSKKITDIHDVEAVCKIARKLGHSVCRRQCRWYENNQLIVL